MSKNDLSIQGFLAGAVKGGIRGKDRLDIGLIYSEKPAAVAGVFTTNRVKAAPVLLAMEQVRSGQAQAILVNSGIANACTGKEGMTAARQCSRMVAEVMNISEEHALVSSTGVIGMQLDVEQFRRAMPKLKETLSPGGFDQVALAMMTTDTVPKTVVRRIDIGGASVKLTGLAKGSGMIMPNMATMLAFIMTDAAVPVTVLQRCLTKSVDRSFNRITVDGDTSTNDTVLVLANGMAGNASLEDNQEYAALFQQALDDLMLELAMKIVEDGEGATKLVTIRINGAKTAAEARHAAFTVANSSLVKTAFFGEDANWGRIIGALGRSGAEFDAGKVDIAFDDVLMVKDGLGQGAEVEKRATEVLKKRKFAVNISLNAGQSDCEVYSSDLSIDYVKINADYRT